MIYLRRTLYGLLISVLLLITSGLIVVYFYGDDVKKYLVKEINNHLNTVVDVKQIKLSLVDEFPLAAIEFIDVSAKDAFTDKTKNTGNLFKARSIFFAFNVIDIFNKKYTIKKIVIKDGNLHLKIDKEGADNYHFWQTSGDTSQSSFKFGLKEFFLQNTLLSYNNHFSRQYYNIQCNKVALSGRFSSEQFDMDAQCDLFVHNLISDKLRLLEAKPLRLDFKINVSDHLKNFVCEKGILTMADLTFETKGKVINNGNSASLDLYLEAQNMNVGSALSLFPEQFLAGIEEYKARGTGYFKSHIYGETDKVTAPRIDVNFGISKGEMIPANNLSALKDIEFKGVYSNGTSHSPETASLRVYNFSATLNNKPVRASFSVSDFTNPFLKLTAMGSSNLADLSAFIKTDTLENLKGLVDFNVLFEGHTKKISKESFGKNNIRTGGDITIKNISFNFKNDPLSYRNLDGSFVLENNNLVIHDFRGNISESDFNFEGVLENLVAYVFLKDQKLHVDATVTSRNLNLDELVKPRTSAVNDTSQSLTFFSDLSCDLGLTIGKVSYKKFESSKLKGSIVFRNKVLSANDLTFSTMDGLINLDGTMDGSRPDSILIACKTSVVRLNVAKMFYQLGNFGQEVIQDKHLKGYLTADIEFASVWSRSLHVNMDKIYAKGKIKIENGELVDFKPLMALSKFVKLNELKRIKFSTLQNEVLIKKQEIIFPSMEIKSNALNMKIEGIHSFSNQVDYRMTLLLSDLLGKKVKDQNTEFGVEEDDGLGHTRLFITMKGDVTNPKFAYDKKSVKQKIKSDISNEKETLKNILKEEFGWFKRDSIKTKKKDLNTVSDGIEIDTDEDAPQERPKKKDEEPVSKAKQQRKDAFKRFKEKLSEPEEE